MPALWIKNARVVDPASRRDAVGDLFARDGLIVASLAPRERKRARTIDALSAENAGLRAEASRPAPAVAAASPAPAYGPGGGYAAQGSSVPSGSPLSPDLAATSGSEGAPPERQVKTLSFGTSAPETAGATKTGLRSGRPGAPPIEVEDSPEYLPPNSYAPARVIVGVDASAGVTSQTDPLPVVLRITGPARSVVNNGKLLTTAPTSQPAKGTPCKP